MLALDHCVCGMHSEPAVVHVAQEDDFAITLVAEDFDAFVMDLVDGSVYDTSEQDRLPAIAALLDDLATVAGEVGVLYSLRNGELLPPDRSPMEWSVAHS
ncbi:hypothetical protein KNE206_73910 [Kitasatospora sp. NE20-6]|uniref:hypothetical protein n=1 Tax=Kitasatospora sp. NE20-6 TaxID=2859066 RepID=UPI0034DC20F2